MYSYVPPHWGKVFGLKKKTVLVWKRGIHFAHFGLESGMVFEGTTEYINVFIVSIPNEWGKKEKYANSKWLWIIFLFAL